MRLDPKTIKQAIEAMVEEYDFDPHQTLEIIKAGIKTAFRKDFLGGNKKIPIVVNINPDGSISIFREYEVVKEVENPDTQIALKEIKKTQKDVKEWDKVLIDITPENLDFSRVAATAAEQTIKQMVKQIEKERFYKKFADKQWQVVNARVVKVFGDDVLLDIDGTPLVLPKEWQIPNKSYNPGEEIKVLLKQIAKTSGWIILDITQNSPEVVEAILKQIIPEVEAWRVEIKKIARIPGKRTKVLVYAEDPRIDPVGVFVGQYGQRRESILEALGWERIDFIEYTDDPVELIKRALIPAKVNHIEIDGNNARVEVDPSQKALAIGKWATNVRTASEITGYKIDII